MELRPNEEIRPMKDMIREWLQHRERELEASFGGVDATTFLNVAQRLKSKGYTEIQQEDYLNIITPEKVRFTITSSVFIEDYCRTDVLEGKTFTAMIKDKTGGESTVDLREYNTRIKVRREVMLKQNDADVVRLLRGWSTQKKAFRVIKRWTFMDEKKGLRFDLSVIRSTPTDERQGNYLWQTQFQQRDITREPLKYEIEVELLHPEIDSGVELQSILDDTVNTKMTHLISGIGEVLRGIQKHTFLIRKSTAVKALKGYEELVGSNRFRGVQPKPMEKRNMIQKREDKIPNIRDGYNVTDKADGLRMMGYVDGQGELFLLDMSQTMYRTGLQRLGCAHSLVDGEFISKDKHGNSVLQYLIFDIYIAPEKTDVSQLPFYTTEGSARYDALQDWISRWSKDEGPTRIPGAGVTVKNCITVGVKQFMFALPGDEDIFECCRKTLMYAQTQPYNTDGLILTPNATPLPAKHGVRFVEQMKWKPAKDNTIDFLVLFDRDEYGREIVRTGVKPGTNETVIYKTMRLYVGSENDPAYTNPRGTVLMKQPLPGAYDKGRGRQYKPVLFNPVDFPDTMANICFADVEINIDTNENVVRIDETGDIVQHNSIVEMTYEPTNEPGWRWVPLRVRHDKTERHLRGIAGRTFNNDEGAEIVWNSIHDPITEHMITRGAEVPSQKELGQMTVHVNNDLVGKVYYDRKDVKEDIQIIRGLRDFHRLYIKENILLGRGLRGGGKIFADLACGQGGDLNTWIREKVGFVFGTDIAEDGITNPHSGAYRRYLNQVMRYGGYDTLPKMIFTIGSSAKRISTGEAGATTEEADIMRSVYGRANTQGPVPPFVQEYGANRLRNGADCVAIMFAIHYFFENQQSLQTIMANISDSLKIGGLFVGCCFDGERIFNELQTIQEGGSIVGQENEAEIWKITKRYANTDLTSGPDSLGMAIDVQFMSIGTEQREYLVPFELLKNEMANIGCELLTPEECKEMSLVHSTNTFDKSYDMAVKEGLRYQMAPDVARYSFFNRWFIFKRRRLGLAVEEVEEEGTKVNIGSNTNVRTVIQQQPQVERKLTLAEKAAQINQEAIAQATKPTGKEKKEVQTEVLGVAPEKTTFDDKELLKFYLDASRVDRLKLNNVDAIRGLSPSFHFPLRDDEGTEYPSVEHYYYAMKFKLASNTPEKAKEIFSTEGNIHQVANAKRQAKAQTTGKAVKAEALTDEDYNSIKEERKAMLAELTDKQLKRYKTVFDDGKWATLKDKVMYDALKQRYEKDDMYRRTIEKATQMGLHLLYYTGPTAGSELGGKMNPDQTIDGQNKVGKMMMRIASGA